MTRSFSESLPDLLDVVEGPMIEIRHDLHAHPELAFEEHRTTETVIDRLVELGYEIRPCPTATGVVARLVGARPGRRVMIRADMDGLPVSEERTDLTFASQNEGIMHACGHDVHVAGLLGVADLLARRRDDLEGEFTLLFQPAEEAISGARAMIEGGVLESNPVDFVIGAHVTSLAPVGLVATRTGILMSDAQSITVNIKGRGGHGAMATVEGNVVLAVSYLAPRLGSVVDELVYEGTADQKDQAVRRLRELLDEVESTFQVACELQLGIGAPAVSNNDFVTASVMRSAMTVVGNESVLTFPPVTPSDDFSEFSSRVPGCYLFVGGALADGSSGMHHSPDFAIDDGACRVVAGVLAAAAVDLASVVA
jgi:amidohydrolase